MKVSLYTSALASMAHETVFLPWLEQAAAVAPKAPNAVAVLVPQRTDAYYLKSLALTAGRGLWGVHFLTPSELRDRIAQHLGQPSRVASREQSRLLLATAAERVSRAGSERATTAVAAGPDQLLKAIDMITGAGWKFGEAGPARLRPIVEEFQQLLDDARWQIVSETDYTALHAVRDAKRHSAPCFTELFVIGFNALHWPLWPMLETAVRISENTVVCLNEPRAEGEELDAAWVGTWENTFGVAEPVASDHVPPFANDLNVPETVRAREARQAAPLREIEFLVGSNTSSHAEAIVARALQYLADPACQRLGVLFPAASALSRRVATLLADLKVPHQDGLAHHAPGPLEDAAWPAWLALQESPRIPTLLHFLRTQPDATFGAVSVEKAAADLQRHVQELLIDDLDVVAAYLEGNEHEHRRALADALRQVPRLPESATLADYFARTGKIFRGFGWPERAEILERRIRDWERIRELSISRRTWLRWLRESLISWRAERADMGSHPYSRLHLLPYIHAESQSWTHLIVAGLNEGQWPPRIEESGFLDEEEIAALNSAVRVLNQRAAVQGQQGEGHVAVKPGKTLCLGPAQRRALLERQFNNTLESTTVALTATLQMHDETAPERPLSPSEFFTRLHFAARGRAVSQQTLQALQKETERWLEAADLWPSPKPEVAEVQSTRQAYDARRNPKQAFGEYEFALRSTPSRPPRLSATQWEKALFSPAPVFLAAMLGVAPTRAEEETAWGLAQGVWVHRWLSFFSKTPDAKTLTPLPTPDELRQRVQSAAQNFRSRLAAALTRNGRSLPDWWEATWQEATTSAAQLAQLIAAVEGRSHAATEWNFDDTPLPFERGTLYVRGRVDLLLGTAAALEDLWLVDYKTGERKALSQKELERGRGIQLGLYALALRAAGAREVGVSLLTTDGSLEKPQVQLTNLDALTDLWNVLLRMQETGVFGMLGPLRDEFGFGQDYPLATLPIDEQILTEKWQRTHPEFAIEGEEA